MLAACVAAGVAQVEFGRMRRASKSAISSASAVTCRKNRRQYGERELLEDAPGAGERFIGCIDPSVQPRPQSYRPPEPDPARLADHRELAPELVQLAFEPLRPLGSFNYRLFGGIQQSHGFRQLLCPRREVRCQPVLDIDRPLGLMAILFLQLGHLRFVTRRNRHRFLLKVDDALLRGR